MYGINEKVYKKLINYFENNSDIKKVILFGSRAKCKGSDKSTDKALFKLKEIEDEDLSSLIKSSIKQTFLEYFILIESFSSMCLKELKLYKISGDMEKSLTKLYESKIIDEKLLDFLNVYRRYRNRMAHVYKQPTVEEIIIFLENNRRYCLFN